MRDILIAHVIKYPKIELTDLIKLLYQSVYGPAHFHSRPTLEAISLYLEKELAICETYSQTLDYEEIGNGYYRISLNVIKNNKMTIDNLAKAFHDSMGMLLENRTLMIQRMDEYLDLLLLLIKQKIIKMNYSNSLKTIELYKQAGYLPTHHSQTYQTYYHPHYRVVHKDFLPTMT